LGKIKSIRFKKNNFEYIKPFSISVGTSTTTQNIEVILETEEGYIGFGEASPSFRVTGERIESLLSLEKAINDALKGENTRKYKRIFEKIDQFFSYPSLKTALQYAVLDALCEELGIQVCEFLGGKKDIIETDKTIGIASIEERIEEAEKTYKEGFRILKIKIGKNIYEDLEVMEEIYKRTKGATYILDANTSYSPKLAIQFTQKLFQKGIDIALLEQPVPIHDKEGLKLVRFNSPYPIGADESAKNKYDVLDLIKNEAVDYINIKLMKCGISDALTIVEIAQASHISLMIGCMGESSLGINQSVHFALGTGAFTFHDLDSALMLKEDKFRGKYKVKIPYYKIN
jgi:L-alanine-DL-glutamate epimerase-like enolase superfamily enzyme